MDNAVAGCGPPRDRGGLRPPSLSKRTPWRAKMSIVSAPACTNRLTTSASQSPSPALSVSAKCSAGSSSRPESQQCRLARERWRLPSPRERAISAQQDAAPYATRSSGRRCPAPMMTGLPSIREIAIRAPASVRPPDARGRDTAGSIVTSPDCLERVPDVLQGDPLHVRTEIARAHEFDVGILHGDVVAHRAFGHEHDPGGRFARDISRHVRRRAGESASASTSGGHSGWASTTTPGGPRAIGGRRRALKRSCTSQCAVPCDDLDLGFGSDVLRRDIRPAA